MSATKLGSVNVSVGEGVGVKVSEGVELGLHALSFRFCLSRCRLLGRLRGGRCRSWAARRHDIDQIGINRLRGGDAIELGQVGIVTVERLQQGRLRLSQRDLRVEHIELRAGAGAKARAGQTKSFLRLLDGFLLALDGLAVFLTRLAKAV